MTVISAYIDLFIRWEMSGCFGRIALALYEWYPKSWEILWWHSNKKMSTYSIMLEKMSAWTVHLNSKTFCYKQWWTKEFSWK